MKRASTLMVVALCGVLLPLSSAFAKKKADANPPRELHHVTFTAPGLYPEGLAYNPINSEFLVTSLRHGTVGAVTRDGRYRTFLNEPRMTSSFGITIDAPRNRILVGVSDLGVGEKTQKHRQKKLAAVASFDIRSGQLLNWFDLGNLPPGEHFANDLAVDKDGNIFVTDSFAPMIYKIDINGRVSIGFTDPAFAPVSGGGGAGLNGIVAHPDGYLLVVKTDSGELFRIDTNTYDIIRVNLSEPLLYGDGLLLVGGNELIVAENDNGRVVKIRSNDGWRNAKAVAWRSSPLQFPTTLARANGQHYVLESKLPEAFDINGPKSDQFTIYELPF